jgi:hypothetical protein
MARTLLIGDEVTLAATAGAATSLQQASVVRIVNISSGIATVTLDTAIGAGNSVSMTLPAGTVEFLEKAHNSVIFASEADALKASKVGFTA